MNERQGVFYEAVDAYKETIGSLSEEGLGIDPETLTEDDVANLVEHYAALTHTPRATQEKLLLLEQEKQALHAQLLDVLEAIRAGQRAEIHEEGQLVRCVPGPEGAPQYLVATEQGEVPATLGDLLTDGEWGIEYDLDASVPSEIRARYAAEHTKREVRRLLNEQILTLEVDRTRAQNKHNRGGSERKPNVWEQLAERDEEAKPALLGERMVRNYLKKLSIDHDLSYTIYEADLYQDCIDKIDFIVHVKNTGHVRGVTTEGDEDEGTDIAIQFTSGGTAQRESKEVTIKDESLRERLKRQGVSDARVVQVFVPNTLREYRAWKANRKPGGPEGTWSTKQKRVVVSGVLEDIVPQHELEQVDRSLRYADH